MIFSEYFERSFIEKIVNLWLVYPKIAVPMPSCKIFYLPIWGSPPTPLYAPSAEMPLWEGATFGASVSLGMRKGERKGGELNS